MRTVSFDTETHLIKAGLSTPRMVCLSFAERTAVDHVLEGLVDRPEGLVLLRASLLDDEVVLLGHNIWYDLAVACAEDPSLIPLVFAKLNKGLIRDTIVRQQLIDVATGEMKFHVDEDGEPKRTSYSLAALSYRLLKKFLKKTDTWRLKYALLDGVPISEWPEEASKYAIDDAVTTLEVFESQEVTAGGEIPDSARQHRAAWALHLMSVWGLRTDGAAVIKLKTELEKDFEEAMVLLRTTDLIKQTKKKGVVKDTKSMAPIKARVEAAYAARGEEHPRTDPSKTHPQGQTSTSKKTLLGTGDPDLKLLAEAGATEKLLTTYVPVLESGTCAPICPRYNAILETGRTSCSKPNIQNPPRKGGVRECFIPRPGWVYVFSDYDTLELRSLAQVCLDILGYSSMAEALRRGEDLHLALAAEMLGISMEEAQVRFNAGDAEIKEYRQQAKPANFGFPGGMAAESFREYAEAYNIKLSSEQAESLKDTWYRKWSEMRNYFKVIEQLADSEEPVQQLRSGRIRGGASYCAIANGFFQGLAADLAKDAMYRVSYECYVDTNSPLYGCRPVLFLHDEIGLEVPYDRFGTERSSAAAARLAQIMIEAGAYWIPDVPVTCKPVMCRRWYKGAEAIKMNGHLVPSKPVTSEVDGKKRTTWVADL